METMNYRHGGPWDRGSADAYYGRGRDPHCYEDASYSSKRIEAADMTPEQIAEYNDGFDSTTDRKEW